MNTKEIWRDVKDYEGLYMVSNMGRVKSLGNDRTRKEKILKYGKNDGYLQVMLHKDGNRKLLSVHRLVADAFIPRVEGKDCVDHINGVRDDNRASNLRWCTKKENNNFELAKKHKMEAMERMSKSKSVSVVQLTKDGQFVAEFYGANEASRQTGIHQGCISLCCKGKLKSSGGFRFMYTTDFFASQGTIPVQLEFNF